MIELSISQYKKGHALFMLDNKDYRHTLRTCNIQ